MKKPSLYLASACLFGANTRYNGTSSPIQSLINFCRNQSVLLVCPEIMGGLPVPRAPARLVAKPGGRRAGGGMVLTGRAAVKTRNGRDVTADFIRGAFVIKNLIKSFRIRKSYLKSKSPSCGYGAVYAFQPPEANGKSPVLRQSQGGEPFGSELRAELHSRTAGERLIKSNGVLAALLKKNNIGIISLPRYLNALRSRPQG